VKKTNFIKKSNYSGRHEELKKFIKLNLKYPKEELLNKIEGNVILKFKVNSI
tara:strand:+ start:642 stop:797 length:156 start_codon:yes stop_codon:yes gene_type:complete